MDHGVDESGSDANKEGDHIDSQETIRSLAALEKVFVSWSRSFLLTLLGRHLDMDIP